VDQPPIPATNDDTGSQQAAGGSNAIAAVAVIPSDPLTSAVVGLTQGGNSTQRLMGAVAQKWSFELDECRLVCSDLRKELRGTEIKLSASELSNAVLAEKVATGGSHLRTQLLLVTVGCFLVGVSIELRKNSLLELSWGVLILGIGLLIWGWFPPRTPKK
jgi:hypothetical protein